MIGINFSNWLYRRRLRIKGSSLFESILDHDWLVRKIYHGQRSGKGTATQKYCEAD
jgi:hypothetical protein